MAAKPAEPAADKSLQDDTLLSRFTALLGWIATDEGGEQPPPTGAEPGLPSSSRPVAAEIADGTADASGSSREQTDGSKIEMDSGRGPSQDMVVAPKTPVLRMPESLVLAVDAVAPGPAAMSAPMAVRGDGAADGARRRVGTETAAIPAPGETPAKQDRPPGPEPTEIRTPSMFPLPADPGSADQPPAADRTPAMRPEAASAPTHDRARAEPLRVAPSLPEVRGVPAADLALAVERTPDRPNSVAQTEAPGRPIEMAAAAGRLPDAMPRQAVTAAVPDGSQPTQRPAEGTAATATATVRGAPEPIPVERTPAVRSDTHADVVQRPAAHASAQPLTGVSVLSREVYMAPVRMPVAGVATSRPDPAPPMPVAMRASDGIVAEASDARVRTTAMTGRDAGPAIEAPRPTMATPTPIPTRDATIAVAGDDPVVPEDTPRAEPRRPETPLPHQTETPQRVDTLAPAAAARAVPSLDAAGGIAPRIVAAIAEAAATADAAPDVRSGADPVRVLNVQLAVEGGEVHMRLTLTGDSMSVHLRVGNAEMAAQLRADREVIATLLTEAGYEADVVRIDTIGDTPAGTRSDAATAGGLADNRAAMRERAPDDRPTGETRQDRQHDEDPRHERRQDDRSDASRDGLYV